MTVHLSRTPDALPESGSGTSWYWMDDETGEPVVALANTPIGPIEGLSLHRVEFELNVVKMEWDGERWVETP